ncbi:RHS repeat protein [Chitinimonas arctica]|nr:RHS repeat protein [Chitinimonas arctica]
MPGKGEERAVYPITNGRQTFEVEPLDYQGTIYFCRKGSICPNGWQPAGANGACVKDFKWENPKKPAPVPDPVRPDPETNNPGDPAIVDPNRGGGVGGDGSGGRGGVCDKSGNPILLTSGRKQQVETDYVGHGGLIVQRTYLSSQKAPGDNGNNGQWRFSLLGARLRAQTYMSEAGINQLNALIAYRPDGRILRFNCDGNTCAPTPDVADRVVLNWRDNVVTGRVEDISRADYLMVEGDVESYDLLAERLLQIKRLGGELLKYNYQTRFADVSRSINVSNTTGQELSFNFDANDQVFLVVDSAKRYLRYGYGENGLITNAIRQDGGQRQYLYEHPGNDTLLTGIVDELGVRYATWAYDDSYRPISSEHVGGVDRVTVAWPARDVIGDVTLTNPLGIATTYTIGLTAGQGRIVGATGPGGASCPYVGKRVVYNNGLMTLHEDFDGKITTYGYDPVSQLETQRVTAAGTADARSTEIKWDPTRPLPLSITEPKQRTDFSYDTAGNVLEKSVLDLSTNQHRTSKFSYDANDRLLTSTDPAGRTTRFSYDANGQLASVTDTAGLVTRYSDYDTHGNAGKVLRPDGVLVQRYYDERGRLGAVNEGSLYTRYTYDLVGQMTGMERSTGQKVRYRYDASHRLIAIEDNQGNRIDYVLDAAGNQLEVNVTGAASSLPPPTPPIDGGGPPAA